MRKMRVAFDPLHAGINKAWVADAKGRFPTTYHTRCRKQVWRAGGTLSPATHGSRLPDGFSVWRASVPDQAIRQRPPVRTRHLHIRFMRADRQKRDDLLFGRDFADLMRLLVALGRHAPVQTARGQPVRL